MFVQSAPANEISKSFYAIGNPTPSDKVNDNWDPVTEYAVKVGVFSSLKVKSHASTYSQPAKIYSVSTTTLFSFISY